METESALRGFYPPSENALSPNGRLGLSNMPNYPYISQSTGEERDFFYRMKDVPASNVLIEVDGQKWKRQMVASQLATAGLKPIDPHSAKQFVEKTGQMKGGTIGQMWDYSKEQSEKRAAKMGEDPVKKKYLKNYSKARRGVPNITALQEGQAASLKAANEKMAKSGISISLA